MAILQLKRFRQYWLLALIFIVALPMLWLSLVATQKIHVEIGVDGDNAYIDGFNEKEKNSIENFRWTGGVAELRVPNLSSQYQELRLHAHGWRPEGVDSPAVQLNVAGKPWVSFQTVKDMRTYRILLPRDNTNFTTDIGFVTPAYTSPNDNREIGLAIDWLELNQLDRASGPTPLQFGGQALLLALTLLLIGALALPRGWATASALVAAATLVGANFLQPLWVSLALVGWLIVLALLVAITLLLAPRLKLLLAPWLSSRQATIAWALLVAALALRLLGETHPLFDIHDIGFHRIWLDSATQGQLYIFSTPSEFQSRQTFNPPAGYVLLMPLQLLLPSERLVMQTGIALVDGLGCLFLLLLARELGLSARAGLIALALYIALPINFTMLWWGFATNAMAQSTGLLLLWMLLRLVRRPTRPALAAFVVICMVCILMHVGALVLIVALLGTGLVFGFRRMAPAGRNAAIGGFALALALTGLIYFSAVVGPALASPDAGPPRTLAMSFAKSWAAREIKFGFVRKGLIEGFLPLPLLLAPLGFVQLLRVRLRNPLARPLFLAWLTVGLVFMSVYFGLGLLVRYIYFGVPLFCLGLSLLLDGLWRRQGRLVVLTLIALVICSGVALWVAGVLLDGKPSLLPLTQ